MGHHDEQSQQHGMGQSGLEGSEKERKMLQGSRSGREQDATPTGIGNETYDQSTAYGQDGDAGMGGAYGDAGMSEGGAGMAQGGGAGVAGGGYGQDSGFDRTAGGGGDQDYGTTSTGSGHQGDMTQEPMTQDDPTRSGNTGWNDRSQGERDTDSDR